MPSAFSMDTGISLLSPLMPDAEFPTRAVSPAISVRWDRIIDELLHLRSLQDDWDGQGCKVIDSANIDRTLSWVRDMRRWQRALPPTGAIPGTSGEVVLEWRGEG